MNSSVPDSPVVFLKPRSSIISGGDSIQIPESSKNVHHEVELVILIGKHADSVSASEALDTVEAFGVGLDITARDLQAEAKKAGLPWSLSKGFRTFSPIGNLVPFSRNHDLQNLDIAVQVNGNLRQKGHTSDMIFPVAELISYLSEHFTLWPGDLIFTGTPEGVSPILPGDNIQATIGNQLSTLQVHVS